MRKILQIIPAELGTKVYFELTDGQRFVEPVVCWALGEWYSDEGVTTDVGPMVLDPEHRTSLVYLWDIRTLKAVEKIVLEGEA